MKRLGAALLLFTASAAQAQTLTPSPIYKSYIEQLANGATTNAELGRRLSVMTTGMGGGAYSGVSAGAAYACVQYVDAAMKKVSPATLSTLKLEAGGFEGTLPEIKKYCTEVLALTTANISNGPRTIEEMATFSANYLRDDTLGTVDSTTLRYALGLDMYLAKYPELKSAPLQRGSLNFGTAGEFQNKLVGIMTTGLAKQRQEDQAVTQQANAKNEGDRQEIVQGLQENYQKLSAIIAAGDKLAKEKRYQEALTMYGTGDYISQMAAYYKDQINKKGVTGNITLGGKTMTLLQATDLLNSMVASANKKLVNANKSEDAKNAAIDAAMAQAAKTTLKGDRLTAYQRIGLPFSLSPAAYMGPDVKKTAASMQNARVWDYHRSWTDYGGFTCDIKLTFNGNKLVSRSISTASILPEAQAFCRNKYSY